MVTFEVGEVMRTERDSGAGLCPLPAPLPQHPAESAMIKMTAKDRASNMSRVVLMENAP